MGRSAVHVGPAPAPPHAVVDVPAAAGARLKLPPGGQQRRPIRRPWRAQVRRNTRGRAAPEDHEDIKAPARPRRVGQEKRGRGHGELQEQDSSVCREGGTDDPSGGCGAPRSAATPAAAPPPRTARTSKRLPSPNASAKRNEDAFTASLTSKEPIGDRRRPEHHAADSVGPGAGRTGPAPGPARGPAFSPGGNDHEEEVAG